MIEMNGERESGKCVLAAHDDNEVFQVYSSKIYKFNFNIYPPRIQIFILVKDFETHGTSEDLVPYHLGL